MRRVALGRAGGEREPCKAGLLDHRAELRVERSPEVAGQSLGQIGGSAPGLCLLPRTLGAALGWAVWPAAPCPPQMPLSSPGIARVPRFRTSALLSRTEGTGCRRAEWKGETGKEGMRVPRMQWGQATCLENLWQTCWWLNGPCRAQEGLCWPDLCMYRDNRMSWTHRTPAPPHGGARTTGRAFCESCQTGLRGQRTARLGSDLRR